MCEARVGPPAAGVSILEIEGHVHVYSPVEQRLIALNQTASDIWRLCDGEHDLETIIERLASSYAVDEHRIAEDVRSTVTRLVALGALPSTTRA